MRMPWKSGSEDKPQHGRIRLLEVAIPCRYYARTRAFYEEGLGLPIAEAGRNHVFFEAGDKARIAIVNAEEGDSLVRPTGHGMYLDLSADDLPAVRRRLIDLGVRLLDERSNEYGKAITVHDPESNIVNIFQEGTF
jgi:catechol 2,3-dioxygenase-like lactoylglutathione lyase family enzyme